MGIKPKVAEQVNVYGLAGFYQIVPLIPNKKPDDEVWEEKDTTKLVNVGQTNKLIAAIEESYIISKNKKPAARWPGVDREKWPAPDHLWMLRWLDDSSFTVAYYNHGEDIDWILNSSMGKKFAKTPSFSQIVEFIEKVLKD